VPLDKEIDLLLPKKSLNKDFWGIGLSIEPSVRDTLIEIANDFVTKAKIGKKIVKDYLVTGSIANYNWSKYSDVDLHIVVDLRFSTNNEVLKNYLDAKKSLWNDKHVITMFGHEVEIYVQDIEEPHYSTGTYSLLKDRWITRPKRISVDNLDKDSIVKKVRVVNHYISHLENLYEKREYKKVYELAEMLKEKIRKMRNAGLAKEGEFSAENLVFKVLRRTKKLEKLSELYIKAYDKNLEI